MSEGTRILAAIERGDPAAAEALLPLVYEELRTLAAQRLAQEKPGQTLQATALVHEAYLRLIGDDGRPGWHGRGHFFGAAAEAMRRILVESARRKGRVRHGGGPPPVSLARPARSGDAAPRAVLGLGEALGRLPGRWPSLRPPGQGRNFSRRSAP